MQTDDAESVCENRAACSLMGAVVFGRTREAEGTAFFGRMRAGPMWVRIVRERRSAESVASCCRERVRALHAVAGVAEELDSWDPNRPQVGRLGGIR